MVLNMYGTCRRVHNWLSQWSYEVFCYGCGMCRKRGRHASTCVGRLYDGTKCSRFGVLEGWTVLHGGINTGSILTSIEPTKASLSRDTYHVTHVGPGYVLV
jgi:hypothetical protein